MKYDVLAGAAEVHIYSPRTRDYYVVSTAGTISPVRDREWEAISCVGD